MLEASARRKKIVVEKWRQQYQWPIHAPLKKRKKHPHQVISHYKIDVKKGENSSTHIQPSTSGLNTRGEHAKKQQAASKRKTRIIVKDTHELPKPHHTSQEEDKAANPKSKPTLEASQKRNKLAPCDPVVAAKNLSGNLEGADLLRREQQGAVKALMGLEQNSVELGRKLIMKSIEINKTLKSMECYGGDAAGNEDAGEVRHIQNLLQKMQKKMKKLISLNEGFKEGVAMQKIKQFCKSTQNSGVKRLKLDNS